MNKEQKVISLKLAKELQQIASENKFELPESELYWYRFFEDEEFELFTRNDIINNLVQKKETYTAYNTSELGEILPEQIIIRKDYIMITKNWLYSIHIAEIEMENIIFDKNLSEAMGKMLVYLLKNKII